MGRRKKGDIINGWVNLDKPADLGSTEAVSRVRRLYNAQKAGHAGTLDPLASGILPIALGEATKTIPFAQDELKLYSFAIRWGEERTTDDAEGTVTVTSDVRPATEALEKLLPQFTGEITQIPPQFSAIKIKGARAYDMAREGQALDLPPRQVYIEELTLTANDEECARLRSLCGKGTYMRSLARDIARALGSAGHITDLRREEVGPFTTDNAISLEKLEELAHSARLDEALLPVETVLDDIPALALDDREAARLKNGQKLTFFSRPDQERLEWAGIDRNEVTTALAFYDGKPLALVDVKGPEIQPVRVLNL